MKKTIRRQAQLMLERAQELKLRDANGKPLVLGQIEELIARSHGARNAHAFKSSMRNVEEPALRQEDPTKSGNDYELVHGTTVWIGMGAFTIKPQLTDEGVVVDVYARDAEEEVLTSTYAFSTEAIEQFCEFHGIDFSLACAAVAREQGLRLDTLPAHKQITAMLEYMKGSSFARHRDIASEPEQVPTGEQGGA